MDDRGIMADANRQVVTLKQRLGQRAVEFEIERDHHLNLHVEQLALREGVVGHLDEVRDHGRVQLVELAGDEHGSDPNQLEVRQSLDLSTHEEPVNEVHCRLNRLGQQPELDLDDDEPVDEDFAVLRGQLRLPVKIIALMRRLFLTQDQVLVDGLDVVSLDKLNGRWHSQIINYALSHLLKWLHAVRILAIGREAAEVRLGRCALVLPADLVLIVLDLLPTSACL